MSSERNEIRRLKSEHTKSELKEILSEELGNSYTKPIPGSLKNEFMTACYHQLSPNESIEMRLQRHTDYSEEWSKKGNKFKLATVIKMVLEDRVNRDKHDSITSLSKSVIAELIVALRLSESEYNSNSKYSEIQYNVPEREELVDSQFDQTLELDDANEDEMKRWIELRRGISEGLHAVYVIDCTPPVGAEENSRMKAVRAKAARKIQNGRKLTELEQAGNAANNGERIYYVGYATDVPTRVQQHISGADAGSARFTNLFKPRSLVEISWYETASIAKEHERRRAAELTVSGRSYGYYN